MRSCGSRPEGAIELPRSDISELIEATRRDTAFWGHATSIALGSTRQGQTKKSKSDKRLTSLVVFNLYEHSRTNHFEKSYPNLFVASLLGGVNLRLVPPNNIFHDFHSQTIKCKGKPPVPCRYFQKDSPNNFVTHEVPHEVRDQETSISLKKLLMNSVTKSSCIED